MILSQQSLFSDKQAITATALSTNVIDTGEKGTPTWGTTAFLGDIGKGTKIPLAIVVNEDFDNVTSVTVTVETGDAPTLGTALASATLALADLKAGALAPLDIVPLGVKRYLGIRYTVTGTAPTTGKITAGITHGAGNNRHGV